MGNAGPTHHYALGIGHHADTIAKIADVLGIEYVIVKIILRGILYEHLFQTG